MTSPQSSPVAPSGQKAPGSAGVASGQRAPGSSKLRGLLIVLISLAASSLVFFVTGTGTSVSSPDLEARGGLDPILGSQEARRLLSTLKAVDSMADADISGVSSQQRSLERQLLALTSRAGSDADGQPAGVPREPQPKGFAAAVADLLPRTKAKRSFLSFQRAPGDEETGGAGETQGAFSGVVPSNPDAVCKTALSQCRENLARSELKIADLAAQNKEASENQQRQLQEEKPDGAKGADVIEALKGENQKLKDELDLVKAQLLLSKHKSTQGTPGEDAGPAMQAKLAELKAELEKLQQENRQLKETQKQQGSTGSVPEATVGSLEQEAALAELRTEVKKLRKENAELTAAQSQQMAGQTGSGQEQEKAASEIRAELERVRQENVDLKKAAEVAVAAAAQSQPAPAQDGSGSSSEELERLRQKVKELQEKNSLALIGAGSVDPATAAEAGKKAMEAAGKALEECGAKQASPPKPLPGSKLTQCEATEEELQQYLNYKPRQQCPDDWYFVQKLIFLKNCYSLPTRRCFAPMPENYKEPSIPFPQSLFDQRVLQNENVRWTKQYWPNYDAINNRTLGDCRDCFNLTKESWRWQVEFYGTVPIDYVLSLKPKGSIKIGLDAGGGTGSFAAKMAERGVTIVTTAMNTETLGDRDGGLPYMDTIAQRGLIPYHIPHRARQPFFDGTLDIIHNINSVKYLTIPEFEELMFEWDRILRPGGIMWFELFYAPVAEMPLYVSVLDILGYKKLYWNMTPKDDAAERKHMGAHVYLNAVLEKPRRKDNPPALDNPNPAGTTAASQSS